MRSMHGTHVHGFPNAFLVQHAQGANFLANVPHNLADSAKTVASVVRHAIDNGLDVVEASREAEDAWLSDLVPNRVTMSFLGQCTPGYYNNEGQASKAQFWGAGYPQGPAAYFRYIDQWRRSGTFDGLAFAKRAG
jgi:cyclohexanone monooxygenase